MRLETYLNATVYAYHMMLGGDDTPADKWGRKQRQYFVFRQRVIDMNEDIMIAHAFKEFNYIGWVSGIPRVRR